MSTKENNNIYDMVLHDKISLNKHLTIQRVPGGWNYIYTSDQKVTVTFVPYSTEFKKSPKLEIGTREHAKCNRFGCPGSIRLFDSTLYCTVCNWNKAVKRKEKKGKERKINEKSKYSL
ncbi:MAG: hypothetical protein ACTSQA_00630 [Candidatus Heimdallarchaeaceae archaeon]